MTATQLYHVGILVNDLEAGIEHFSSVLGLHFENPRVVRMEELEMYGKPDSREVRLAHSLEGPPYLELIEGHEDGIWGLEHGEGLHHIGGWQEGLDDRVAQLLLQGHTADLKVYMPQDDLVAIYLGTSHPTVHNTRIELVVPGVADNRRVSADGQPGARSDDAPG